MSTITTYNLAFWQKLGRGTTTTGSCLPTEAFNIQVWSNDGGMRPHFLSCLKKQFGRVRKTNNQKKALVRNATPSGRDYTYPSRQHLLACERDSAAGHRSLTHLFFFFFWMGGRKEERAAPFCSSHSLSLSLTLFLRRKRFIKNRKKGIRGEEGTKGERETNATAQRGARERDRQVGRVQSEKGKKREKAAD